MKLDTAWKLPNPIITVQNSHSELLLWMGLVCSIFLFAAIVLVIWAWRTSRDFRQNLVASVQLLWLIAWEKTMKLFSKKSKLRSVK